jgi:hypothetical protein
MVTSPHRAREQRVIMSYRGVATVHSYSAVGYAAVGQSSPFQSAGFSPRTTVVADPYSDRTARDRIQAKDPHGGRGRRSQDLRRVKALV